MKLRKPSLETSVLIVIYAIVFLIFIFQEALFTYDSYGYLLAMPQRNPGYVIFIKFFEFVFPQNYGKVIVGVQLVLGLFAVHLFLKKISSLLKLNIYLKVITLICLLFPFFSPLLVANNMCSEGLTYPLYLLFLFFCFEFLYHEKKYTLLSLFIIYILLVLTRGQFVITSLIIAFVYFFKYRTNIKHRKHLSKLIFILLFPIVVIFVDKTYHKLKDGLFISTPYTFVNMSGAAFYVSKEHDINYIENEEYKKIFEACHKGLTEKKLLLTSTKRDGYDDYYQHFHNHVPQISNQTVHEISRGYYFDKYLKTHKDKKAASVFSMWQSDLACKSMFFTLVTHNFKDWSLLYFSNLIHGFKSILILFFVVFAFLFSAYKVIFDTKKNYEILFICSALTLSNALIISLASHSIMRYLFYNYILIFFMVIILIQNLINVKRT